MDYAIDPRPDKALAEQTLKQLLIFSLAILNHRREEQYTGSLLKGQHPVHHFTHRACGQGDIMIWAPWLSDPGVEQPQVVIDLGYCPTVERGLCDVAFCSILMAGDRPSMRSTSGFSIGTGIAERRQRAIPRNGVGLRHRSCRRQGRTSGSRKPRDHNQLVARQVDVDTLQVVGPGPRILIWRMDAGLRKSKLLILRPL